jgi:alanine dehydrogenase
VELLDKEVILLSYEDVEKLFDPVEIIEAVEEAFRLKALGKVQMPPKQYLFFRAYNGDLRIMPAYIEELDIAGVKIVNVHPDNPKRYGMPTVMAIVTLVDPRTGRPLAVMDGTMITAWRTGAAGAIAAKYLARRNSRILSVIGAGVQGAMQILFTLKTMPQIEKVVIYDIDKARAEKLASQIAEHYPIKVEVADSPRTAAEQADILATCTPSRKPIVEDSWIKPGTHINAIGADAPGKEELDPRILLRAKIVVDDRQQAIHSGEINVPISKGILKPEQIYAELGEIIAGLKPGRESDEEITVFDSTGIAIQDVAAANTIYKKALKTGIRKKVKLVKMWL